MEFTSLYGIAWQLSCGYICDTDTANFIIELLNIETDKGLTGRLVKYSVFLFRKAAHSI